MSFQKLKFYESLVIIKKSLRGQYKRSRHSTTLLQGSWKIQGIWCNAIWKEFEIRNGVPRNIEFPWQRNCLKMSGALGGGVASSQDCGINSQRIIQLPTTTHSFPLIPYKWRWIGNFSAIVEFLLGIRYILSTFRAWAVWFSEASSTTSFYSNAVVLLSVQWI